jgi:uncharacterized Zn-finger protein
VTNGYQKTIKSKLLIISNKGYRMNARKKTACSERQIVVTKKDLPLSCPGNDRTLWNAHPKVYLPIEKSGQVSCPYCGCLYILEEA